MKLLTGLLCLSLWGCVARPYEGKRISIDSNDVRTCGLHGTKLEEHSGFFFSGGLIRGTEPDEFARLRYPNTRSAGFSRNYDDDDDWPYTRPGKIYTCDDCYKGHERLELLPMWYKRLME